jgi:signal transduction histidine kinase
MAWSVRTQIVLLVVVLCMAISGLLATILPAQIEAVGMASTERRAGALAALVATGLAPAVDFDDAESAFANLSNLASNREVQFARVIGRNGKILAEYHPEAAPPDPGGQPTDGVRVWFLPQQAVATSPIQTAAGAEGRLIIGLSLDGLHADTRAGRTAVLRASAAVLLLGLAFAWALGVVLTRPIRRVVDAARQVADGNLTVGGMGLVSHQKWRESANEAVQLTGAVSEMAARITTQLEHLRGAEQEARAASTAKSMFLANMSHELRTPLNAIIGYSEILQEDLDEGSSSRQDVRRIWAAGSHLLCLINDILDLAKIESGKMDLFVEEVDLRGVVEDALSSVRPTCEHNGNRLSADWALGEPTVRTDATKVRQVLVNLLTNAAKFTTAGDVTLRITRVGRSVQLEVSDTGIGIPAEKLERLFQPFVQADASTTKRYGGTGLGLVLVRHLCTLLGGEVSVRSLPGAGSTFTATFLDQRGATADGRLRRTQPPTTITGAAT